MISGVPFYSEILDFGGFAFLLLSIDQIALFIIYSHLKKPFLF
jgi:hypothetical protein